MGLAPPTEPLAKSVAVYFYRPGRSLFHVAFVIDHRPGSLLRLLTAIPVPGVNLLHLTISISNGGGGEIAAGHLYAEAAPDVDLEALTAALRTVPGVRAARLQAGSEGLLVDDAYPLSFTAGGPTALLQRRAAFSRMIQEIRDTMRSGGLVLLYEQGLLYGQSTAREDVRAIGSEFARRNLPTLLTGFGAMGWGQMQVASAESRADRLTIRVQDSLECVGQTSAGPLGHYLRGLFAGYASGIWDAPVECTERACVAMGALQCEFLLARSAPGPSPGR